MSDPGPLPWYVVVVVGSVTVCVQGLVSFTRPEGPAIGVVVDPPPLTTVHTPPANVPP